MKTTVKETPQEQKESKRYLIYAKSKSILKTDDEEKANKEVEKLKEANEVEFVLTDTFTGSQTHFHKETYQKNYRVTQGKIQS